MFRQQLPYSLIILCCLFVFRSQGEGAYYDCNNCEMDCCFDQCNTCQTESCLNFFPPTQLVPWTSYTYFCIDDHRSDGLGVARGQNVVFAFNYLFNQCLWLTPFGSYESTKNSSPILDNFIDGDNFPQQTVTKAEGWGGGAQLNYQFACNWIVYASYAYVHLKQHVVTKDLTNLSGDVLNDTHGRRWQVVGGLNAIYSTSCITFNGDLNYLYVSNRLNESVDSFRQRLTDQNSTLGIGRAKACLFFFPLAITTPFVSGGMEVDINRHNHLPIFFPVVGPSSEVTFFARDRFEWNVGTGVLFKKDDFTFSFTYQYKRRSGPIKTNVICACASLNF